MRRLIPCFLACGVAALLPLLTSESGDASATGGDMMAPWPSHFEGRLLTEIPLANREALFAAGFPGHIATFTDGRRRIIFRWIQKPTRKVHPAAHCFRGGGYTITPSSPHRDGEGNLWNCFEAQSRENAYRVRERVFTENRSWSDVSAWYWGALWGKEKGPFRNVVVIEDVSP